MFLQKSHSACGIWNLASTKAWWKEVGENYFGFARGRGGVAKEIYRLVLIENV